MKRYLLVTTIVVAMVLSMVGSAFAFSDVAEDAAYATDFDVLEAVNVYQGYPDGTAKPDNAITRAEFAAVVVRMLDKESVADAVASYETSFTDDAAIADWARGYIIVANSLGIINGYPDGSFQPANNVTYAEAIAMLVRMLKLDDAATGSWPTNYLVLGADVGLTDGVDPIANLPITRGEMAVMSVNALFSSWFINDDDELEEGPDDECLLYDLDDDVYEEYGEIEIAGTITDYLPSSGRIKVAGEYYYLEDDIVNLVVNDYDYGAFDFADFDISGMLPGVIVEDDEVVLTLNSDDEVTGIEVTRDTYPDTFLIDVVAEDDETLYGDIKVLDSGFDDDLLSVDDDTVLLLDGEEVTMAELEEAFDDFQDEYGDDAEPVVTVRTEGDVEDTLTYVIYASVITTNTVEGEVTAVGNDGDPYIRIDGEKVYYDDEWLAVGCSFDVGDEVTLLLNSDDVAMVLLEAAVEEDHYYAKAVEYTVDSDDELDTLTVELADGTEVVIDSFDDAAATLLLLESGMLNDVLDIEINEFGDAVVQDPQLVGYDYSGEFVDYSSTWIEVFDYGLVANVKVVRAENLFVVTEGGDFGELSDIDEGEYLRLFMIDGIAGFIMYVPLP